MPPTTEHWKTQEEPNAYGDWLNCCIPEPRGIWQKDLPPMPDAVGRNWEGVGASKRRTESESGWSYNTLNENKISGIDYIPRSCDLISSDAYDTFLDGRLGRSAMLFDNQFRYKGKEMGNILEWTDDNEPRWLTPYERADRNNGFEYDSNIHTTVDYLGPTGMAKQIWDTVYDHNTAPPSDKERFREECINSNCQWYSLSKNDGRCVEIIKLNGIITFDHIGTGTLLNEHKSKITTGAEDYVQNEGGHTFVGTGANKDWQQCVDDWRWFQLDTQPGRLDRTWYTDIVPNIKIMIIDFFRANNLVIDPNDIIIENNIVTRQKSNGDDLLIQNYNIRDTDPSGGVPRENINVKNYHTLIKRANTSSSNVGCYHNDPNISRGYGGYNLIDNKHPIKYTINIPCPITKSSEECINLYKEIQKKFTYTCEEGQLSMNSIRHGMLHTLTTTDINREMDSDLPISKFGKTQRIRGSSAVDVITPPLITWNTTSTPEVIKTCELTSHNCNYSTNDINISRKEILDENGEHIEWKDVINSTPCFGDIDNNMQELCTDMECCTRPVVYCHSGVDKDDIESRYNKSLGSTDDKGNKLTDTITFGDYGTGIPRSGLNSQEANQKKIEFLDLKSKAEDTHPTDLDINNYKEFITKNGVCRNTSGSSNWQRTDHNSIDLSSDDDWSCPWDLGYSHIGGGLIIGVGEGIDTKCPIQSSGWSLEGGNILNDIDIGKENKISSPWRTTNESDGVEYEGGYCVNTSGELGANWRNNLSLSKNQCLLSGKKWVHGPILCNAENSNMAINNPPIHTGSGDDMCSNSIVINQEYMNNPPTCKERLSQYFEGQYSINDHYISCNNIDIQLKEAFNQGNDISSLRNDCINATLQSSTNLNNLQTDGLIDEGVVNLFDRNDKICIYEGAEYEGSGAGINDTCQLGICSPPECIWSDDGIENINDDTNLDKCRNQIGRHNSSDYLLTKDLSDINNLLEMNESRDILYNTCESENYDCGISLNNSTELYDSNNKKCFNYIMKSDKWAGGKDTIDYLENNQYGDDSLSYLSGCDGIETNPLPIEKRINEPCSDVTDYLNVFATEKGISPISTNPICYDEESLSPKNEHDIIDYRMVMSIQPNSCCESVVNEDCDSYEGGSLCFENTIKTSWITEGMGGNKDDSIQTKDDCIQAGNLWASGCSKSNLYWNESNPSAIIDHGVNWISDIITNWDANIAASAGTGSIFPTSLTLLGSAGNIDVNKKQFWERKHSPRMIYDTELWLGSVEDPGPGYENWMDGNFLTHAKVMLKYLAEIKKRINTEEFNRQNSDTWRPGPCNFACANYRSTTTGDGIIYPITDGSCPPSGDVSCEPPIYDWPAWTSTQLKNEGGSTSMAKEMRERCNICLASWTIE